MKGQFNGKNMSFAARQEEDRMTIQIGAIDTIPEHDPYHRGECEPTVTTLFINPRTELVTVGQEMDQGAIDADVWHERIIAEELGPGNEGEITLPDQVALETYLNSEEAAALLQTICDEYSIDWDEDGHNVGNHTDASASALATLINAINNLPHIEWKLYSVADYLAYDVHVITAETTDGELSALADEWDPKHGDDAVVLDVDILDYITEYRNNA